MPRNTLASSAGQKVNQSSNDRQVNYTMEPKQLEPGKPRGKCRKWQLRVRVGINPKTGNYSERTRTFAGTYRQAVAATEEFEEEVKNLQSSRPGRKLTFEQLAAEYVPHRLDMRQIKPRTATKITNLLKALSHHVGKMPADKLEPYMIQDAVKAMLSGDSASGKPLSGTYVNMVLQTASTMYNLYAIPQGLATRNPFDNVERPKIDTKERDPLTEKQQEGLIEAACYTLDQRFTAVMIALLGGAREGEVCNAIWKNVDLLDGIMLLPDTKGSSRLTAVPIQQDLVAYLLAWKEEQAAMMAQFGIIQHDETYVCANELGDRLTEQTIGRWWRRNRKILGCDGIHFHDLRHTFATNLAKNNVHPGAIQKLLRQRDDRMATRIYVHVNTQQMRDAVDRL